MILLRNNLNEFTETLCASERLVIIGLGNASFVNIYLPCVGTSDRNIIIDDIFDNIAFWSAKFAGNMCIVGGDFNTDLTNVKCATSAHLKEKFAQSQLHTFNCVTKNSATYANEALNHSSTLDYFVLSDTSMSHRG